MSLPYPEIYPISLGLAPYLHVSQEPSYFETKKALMQLELVPGADARQYVFLEILALEHPMEDIAHSYFNLFYNRVHIIPGKLTLGNIASQQSQEIYIWNAFLTGKNLISISEVGTEGIELQPPDLPAALKPLQETIFTLLASVDGPPVIDAIYTFTFDFGSYDFLVSGNRAVLLAFPPSRDSAYEEELFFPSTIFTAAAGTEQRMSLSDDPKISASYSAYVFDEEMWLLESRLWGWQAREFTCPIWKSSADLTAAVQPGSFIVPVTSTEAREFAPGKLATLWASPQINETFEVAEVNATEIVAVRPIGQYWPAGTSVMPIRSMRLSREVSYSGGVANEKEFSFSLATDAAEPQLFYSWPFTFDGLPVMEFSPDMKGQISGSFSRNYEPSTTPYGKPYIYDRSGIGTQKVDWLFTFTSRLEAYRFISLLCQLRGVCGEFWMPSWGPDFKVVETVAANSAVLKIKSVGIAGMYADLRGKHGVRIELRDGRVIYRQLSEIRTGSASGQEELVLSSVISEQILAAQIRYVSFLVKSRFDQDRFKFIWSTREWAELQVSVKGLSDAI